MPLLHPSIPEGSFDLPRLLEYEPPEHWRPEPGDKVLGTLVKIADRSRFKVIAPTMWILVPPKAYDEYTHRYVVVRAAGVVLKNAVEQYRPQPGEKVAVKFVEMRTGIGSGREYRFYQFGVFRGGRWLVTR